jgi:hypothetical protein
MIPTFAFEDLLNQVGEGFDRKYGDAGQGCSRLVGLVFARPDSPFVKSELLPHLGYWHYRSADHIDFHFAGYRHGPSRSGDPHWEEDINIPGIPNGIWAYSNLRFESFRKELEAESRWKYGGGTELVLLNVSRDHLGLLETNYSSVLSCKLDEMKTDKAITSVEGFFESIFRYAEFASDSDPTWGFSDASGLKIAGVSLKRLVLSLLPEKVAAQYQAAEHLAVRDYTKI